MSLKSCVVPYALTLLFVISYNEVLGIRCYKCSSFIDEKCGTTWGFQGDEAEPYLADCGEKGTGCRKLQYYEEFSGEILVTRSCYNSTTDEADFTPVGCTELFRGETCYCVPKEGEITCNGQSRVVPLCISYVVLAVLLCLAYLHH